MQHSISPKYRRRRDILRLIMMILALGVVIGLLTLLVRLILDMPIVYRQWPTGECVEVSDEAAASENRAPYTCTTVPDWHDSVWVQSSPR